MVPYTRAVPLGDGDGVVGRPGVDDDDLVDQAVERTEARVEVLGLVADDDRSGQAHRTLPEVTAPSTDLVVRPEGPGEQPKGVQPLDPLTVVHVACGAAFALLPLRRIDQPPERRAELGHDPELL